jgi:cation:H+ antiporter
LIVLYSLYVITTLKGSTPTGKTPEPLHITFRKKSTPHWSLVALQLAISVALLIVGSDLFVSQIGKAAASIHISPLLLALVAIPLATEFPETLNSVLWIRSGADSLAFGNVAGSAAFQSCILGFIAVSFTPWRLPPVAVISAVLTICTAAYLLLILRNGHSRGIYLLMAALPWTLFVTLEISLSATGAAH